MKLLEKLRTTPDWQSDDSSIRAAAVRDLDGELRDVLMEIAQHDEDPAVRREAVARIQDVTVLGTIAAEDDDRLIREQASSAVRDLAIAAEEATPAERALAALPVERDLVAVARSARLESVGRAALARLRDARALGLVARSAGHAEVAKAALARLEDSAEIEAVALKADDRGIALTAFERLSARAVTRDTLEAIAKRAKQKAVARRARAELAALDNAEPPATSDEAKRICERLEALATADDFEHGREALGRLLEQWAALDAPAQRAAWPASHRRAPRGRNPPLQPRGQKSRGAEGREDAGGRAGATTRPSVCVRSGSTAAARWLKCNAYARTGRLSPRSRQRRSPLRSTHSRDGSRRALPTASEASRRERAAWRGSRSWSAPLPTWNSCAMPTATPSTYRRGGRPRTGFGEG